MKSSERLKQRYQTENKILRNELARRTRELSFFINSAKALTSTLDSSQVTQAIMKQAQRLIKCDAWSLLLLEEDFQQLRFVAAKGEKNNKIKEFRLNVGEGIAGWVAKHGKPLIINDVAKDRRFDRKIDKVTRYKTRSVLCIPLTIKKRTIGVLEMVNKAKGVPFAKKDQDLLLLLADQAAIALERAHLHERVSNLAITDDLTKLYNFRYLNQMLDRELKRSHRYNGVLSIIFLDMDFFKTVNDTHGHLMGSKVLIEVGRILLRSLRIVDVIARYGGDEFVVVLPETNVKTGIRIAQRLLEEVQRHEFLKSEGIGVHLSASFGVAGFPEHAMTKRDLFHVADQAMYLAKNGGRAQVCVAGKRTGKPRALKKTARKRVKKNVERRKPKRKKT